MLTYCVFSCFLVWFQNLQELHLHNMNIGNIHKMALQGNEQSLSLILIRNCTFQSNATFSWAKGSIIKLLDMNIRELTRNSFDGLQHLKMLYLQRLNLTTIEKHALSNLPNLRRIYISECPLAALKFMKNLSSLSLLSISDASFVSIQYDAIIALSSLKTLKITKGLLGDLFPDITDSRRSHLCLLSGGDDQLNQTMSCKKHGQEILYPTLNLTKLDLSRNAIRSIFPATFFCFPTLHDLKLGHNKINELHVDSFIGLHNLELLDLSSNKILSLPKGIFVSLTKLRSLRLSDNHLKHLFSRVNRFRGFSKKYSKKHFMSTNRTFCSV